MEKKEDGLSWNQVELDGEYSLLMNTLGVSVSKHLMDEHFTLIWANDYYYQLIGYPKEEYERLFRNQCDRYFVGNETVWKAIVDKVLEALAKGEQGYNLYAPMRRKDSSMIWVKLAATFTNEYYKGSRISYTVMTNVEELMQIRVEQTVTYDNIPGFIAKYRVTKDRFQLVEANDKFIDFFGLDRLSLTSYNAFSKLDEKSKRLLNRHLPLMLKGESVHLVVHSKDKQGNDAWLQLNGACVGWVEGDPVYLIVYIDITDITEQRELQKKLEEQSQKLQEALASAERANQAKSDFLARMSHDLRTPLNAVVGMTAIAGAHLGDNERVLDCLRKITGSSKLLLSLINEVLDMSKIESGRLKLSDEEFNIGELLQDMIVMMQPEIKRRKQQLDIHVLSLKHEDVIGDSQRIKQVLMNILSNAVKYTLDEGHILVEIREEEGTGNVSTYEFAVTDNGRGMKPEFLRKIFEPFERADDQEIRSIQGTGLGMAISHSIVELMGGRIEVKSEYGKGSCFRVRMPLHLQAEAGEEEIVWPDFCSVLIIDDDRTACESTSEYLKEIGLQSEWVCSGREGLEAVKRRCEKNDPYFSVLVDLKMPDMNGIEVAKRMREFAGAAMPILLLSAYDIEEYEREAREAGIDGFIPKPLFKSKLISVLSKFTRKETARESYGVPLSDDDYTGKRILLVEDNELNREIALEIVGSTGAGMCVAVNGLDAVEKFSQAEEGALDMILMDIQMPVMDGYEATRRIRALDRADAKAVPIIAMTANAFSEDVKNALASGMNHHVAKPFDIAELMKILRKYLARN